MAATLDYRDHAWHDEDRTDPSGTVSFGAAPFGLLDFAAWQPERGPAFVDHHHGPGGRPVQVRMARGAGRQITVRLAEAAALAGPDLTLSPASRRADRRHMPAAAARHEPRQGMQPWQLVGLPNDAEFWLEAVSVLGFVAPPMTRIPPGSDPATNDLRVHADLPAQWRPPIHFRVTGIEAPHPVDIRLAVRVHDDSKRLTTDVDGTTTWPARSIVGSQLEVSCLSDQLQAVAMGDEAGRRATRIEEQAGPLPSPSPMARRKLADPPEGDLPCPRGGFRQRDVSGVRVRRRRRGAIFRAAPGPVGGGPLPDHRPDRPTVPRDAVHLFQLTPSGVGTVREAVPTVPPGGRREQASIR